VFLRELLIPRPLPHPESDGLGSYESHGSVHKQLTFSEFLGQSYDAEVSQKFVEYLKLCFHVSPSHESYSSISADIHLPKAKEERQLYTLKPIPATAATPLPISDAPIAPASEPLPVLRTADPVPTRRTSTQARMKTGPMTPALKAHVLRGLANKTSEANETHATIPPVEDESVEPTEPTEPSQSTLIGDPRDNQRPPSSRPPEDSVSDSISYTSTLPDVFEVGMDNSAPPATGPWMIIDHFTGEVIADEEEDPPATPAAPGTPFDSVIQVEVTLGVPTLIQTPPPTLLFVDKDERPDWLIRSTTQFLQHAPYYMCLSKVVDLFFAQEASLGYPNKVSEFYFLSCLHSLTAFLTNRHSPLTSLYHLEIGLLKSPCL